MLADNPKNDYFNNRLILYNQNGQDFSALKAKDANTIGAEQVNDQTIRNDLNNNISATTALNSTVTDLNTWKTSTASVQLSSLITTTGQLESRAFLGVSSVSGGKAVVAGLTVNSVNNGIIMRGSVFGLENIAGTPVLYWSDSDNTLNIKARILLS